MISIGRYVKSSFSDSGGCVEVALLEDGTVGLRDSKNTAKPPHVFTKYEWQAFVAGVRNGEFDISTE
jgi:hypothetical protein